VKRLRLPVAVVQGMWMRSTIELAPPATGPTSGTVGTVSRPPLRIAVVGDSTAAGCGVNSHDDGFAGCLARELAARTQQPVRWQVVGEFGATARRIRYRLLPQLGEDLDVAVLLAGGNDVMSRRSPGQWRNDLSAIVDDLAERADHVVIAGIPPFALFPSIPTTLGHYLSERAAALHEVTRQICAGRSCTTWVTTTGVPPADFFASDRFHPSAVGYQLWAHGGQTIDDEIGRLFHTKPLIAVLAVNCEIRLATSNPLQLETLALRDAAVRAVIDQAESEQQAARPCCQSEQPVLSISQP
jgi:lysophospholipase L1-like esterase